jgi:hypothetical protein
LEEAWVAVLAEENAIKPEIEESSVSQLRTSLSAPEITAALDIVERIVLWKNAKSSTNLDHVIDCYYSF